ncbi:MAG TPA: FKBP-type peptidyl-prolyl cis-trans isomerase [Saprospiraceae bacterium]|jgi:FKBP-type peptidyl-prolyl cis-trans isomerase|nr:MAG: FKBP-type peptidylprolyl isomerase [Candidatus Parvibacillus calidus]MBX2936382.1 FKBP-type peptidyl-prolyl cis-trans isomerase [Saprospiraceae bacterium]HNS13683.1 FKBP-type peptidyl-prolyl cis-trans isomerase [Bacteroidia bacterium]MBK7739191.1 FKBP-type peptidyl-prolyl cis-trans isomerase [Candidatus Parvibacillus calidus]MCB0592158.1 FKBP-type peptidyl-prolyl cis-trans isomerase [Saprospiraceae bacterium]
MKKFSVLILFAMVMGMISCKNNAKDSVTKHGYPYTLFPTGSGDLIQDDDVVFFDMQILHKDSILQDSRNNPIKPEFAIPADSLVTTPNPVIDALRLMRKGDSVVVREKIDTVQGLPENMKDWKEITYRIKVTDVLNKKEKQKIKDMEPGVEKEVQKLITDYNSGAIKDLKTTPTGLKYVILQDGNGPQIQKGEVAKVHYFGATVSNGKKFDSSFSRGSTFTVPVGGGQVIPGWEEALLLMKKGTKAMVFIPGNLAYGANGIPGMIEPNSELAFYMEILN